MDFDNFRDRRANTDRSQESSNSNIDASPGSDLIIPVVLSGGGGTRLWPFSTAEMPKQFLPLVGERSLFREALDRVGDRNQFAAAVVVGSLQHADLCERELVESGTSRLILEPCSRNTAPAIVMAAAIVDELHGPDAVMLVMPSDHVIEDVEDFHAAIGKAKDAAHSGRLVTFGIYPTGPDTGYGYLQMGAAIAPGVMEVARFVEKPTYDVAEAMVAGGEHLWNAGIFLFRAGTLIQEAQRVAPEIAQAALDAVRSASRDGIRITPDELVLSGCPSDSIDYAIMEKASNVAVVPMAPGWSDLGSWDALAELIGPEASSGPVTALECDDCYIRSDGLEIAALGVRGLIIVASAGRLLVLPRGRSQEVKRLLSAMDSVAA